MNNVKKKYPCKIGRTFESLGTNIDVQIIVVDKQEEELAVDHLLAVQFQYEQWEKKFSRFDSKSELSQLNGKLGVFLSVSPEMVVVCQSALAYYEKSLGFFDPRIIETLESVGYDVDFKNMDTAKFSVGSKKNYSEKRSAAARPSLPVALGAPP